MAEKESGWTNHRPDENGIYWHWQEGALPEALFVHGGFVYDFGDKEPTSVEFFDGRGKWLGPIYASDAEQLSELRRVAQRLMEAAQFSLSTPGLIRGRDQLKNCMEAVAVALNPKQPGKETQK